MYVDIVISNVFNLNKHFFFLFLFLILFQSCCSHAQVFGKTLVHEVPISLSRTEWYLLFSRGDMIHALVEVSPVKN